MSTKFVGWALAHRDNMVGQSPTLLQCRRRRVRSGRLPGTSLAAIITFIILFLFFIFVLLPICGNLFGKLGSRAHQHAKQLSQLRSIDFALDFFRSEFDGYPPSDALDEDGRPYCGAMKLVEATMGQDLEGFHPDSVFRRDSKDSKGTMLYPDSNNLSRQAYSDNIHMRKISYLHSIQGNPYRLKDLYENVGPFDGNEYVFCDLWGQVKHLGTDKRGGMPILYYKANTSKTVHDVSNPNNPDNIYDYRDNHTLLSMSVPGDPTRKHPLYQNPKIFYEMTRNYRSAKTNKPQRADTYILLSAGRDGLYGTEDDIPNFAMQWKPK